MKSHPASPICGNEAEAVSFPTRCLGQNGLAYAWMGLLALELMLAVPVGLAFFLAAVPMVALLRRVNPRLVAAGIGSALAYMMTAPKPAFLGTVGGLVYMWLADRCSPCG